MRGERERQFAKWFVVNKFLVSSKFEFRMCPKTCTHERKVVRLPRGRSKVKFKRIARILRGAFTFFGRAFAEIDMNDVQVGILQIWQCNPDKFVRFENLLRKLYVTSAIAIVIREVLPFHSH
jgi:hypothetical protein